MESSSNGDGGPAWSRYREHTTRGSAGCSSSSGYTLGTIVSTAYTTSNSSRLSSFSSMEAAIHLDMLELDEDRNRSSWIQTDKNDTATEHAELFRVIGLTGKQRFLLYPNIQEVRSLVRDLFDGLATNGGGGHISVVGAWLMHLGVGWLLHVVSDDDALSASKISSHTHRANSWIRALDKIKTTMGLMMFLFPNGGSAAGLQSTVCEQEPQAQAESGKRASIPFEFQYAQLIQQTMFKMLAFVDVIVGPNTETRVHKLRVLLDMHGALSGAALPKIHLPVDSPLHQEVESIQEELDSLLSANKDKTSVSIWSMMEEINKTAFLESIEDKDHSSSSLALQGSSDIIHNATWSVVHYIRLLQSTHKYSAIQIVHQQTRCGKYVPQIRNVPPLTSMTIEVASCLEEKLAKRSESSFLDHSCRFLFLLNNLDVLLQTLGDFFNRQSHIRAFTSKVDAYIESYLQVSWQPLFSCLLNPTTQGNKRGRTSPLTKFEFAFEKTYATQKHLKITNSKLRERLRKSITEKSIPIYTKYIEDSKVTNPKFTPRELEEMLQDLFEG